MPLGLASYSLHCHLGRHPDSAWASPYDAFWILEQASQLGLHGVQLSPKHFELDFHLLERLGRRARELGLYLELGANGIEPRRLTKLLEGASVAGAQVVRVTLDLDLSAPLPPQLETALAILRQVSRSACQYGVFLAIENHQDLTSEELLRLLEQVDSPYVGVCLDFGNNLKLGEAPEDTVLQLAPHTVSVHLKDCQLPPGRDPERAGRLALGEGDLPLRKLIELLVENSEVDRLSIETPFTPYEGDLERSLREEQAQLARSVEYSRKHLRLG